MTYIVFEKENELCFLKERKDMRDRANNIR